jgi:hypothetical protein
MKRTFLHIGFWLAYVIQDVLLTFLVNTTRVQLSTGTNVIYSLGHVLILLIPKLLLTYFVLSAALDRIIREGFGKKWTWYAIGAFLLSVAVYRVLLVFLIYPFIYHWHDSPSYFYALGFPVAMMDIGFVSGVAIALKQMRQQLKRARYEQSLIREKLETELKYLRNQTNPHFLFNTLNNIYALSRRKSDDAPDAIMKLSKLLRFMLYDAAKPLIAIGDEVKLVEDYIDLEKMRYNGKLSVSLSTDIGNGQEHISPLLLLPFVENAFKHGASESRSASFIHIDIKVHEGTLMFTVENSKENNTQPNDGTTIGLNNVKRQLELLYSDYDMQVMNEPAVFTVTLKINLNSYAKDKLPYR